MYIYIYIYIYINEYVARLKLFVYGRILFSSFAFNCWSQKFHTHFVCVYNQSKWVFFLIFVQLYDGDFIKKSSIDYSFFMVCVSIQSVFICKENDPSTVNAQLALIYTASCNKPIKSVLGEEKLDTVTAMGLMTTAEMGVLLDTSWRYV